MATGLNLFNFLHYRSPIYNQIILSDYKRISLRLVQLKCRTATAVVAIVKDDR